MKVGLTEVGCEDRRCLELLHGCVLLIMTDFGITDVEPSDSATR
jgi:hypothetical protein